MRLRRLAGSVAALIGRGQTGPRPPLRLGDFDGALGGTVEVDESYFRSPRPRGVTGKIKLGRSTKKQPVFDIIERCGRIYAELVPDANEAKAILTRTKPLARLRSRPDDHRRRAP